MSLAEIQLKYSLYDEIHDFYRSLLGSYILDYDYTKYILCNMELPVTSIKRVGACTNEDVWKLLLQQKLECDKRFNEVVTYIQYKNIEELDLMELDSILKEFPYNMFFATYFYKCLIGSLYILPSAASQKHSINNVLKHYKNVNNFIEDALECGIYDGNYPFLGKLHKLINELGISFTMSRDDWINWLNNEIDSSDGNEKVYHEKTLEIVRCFRK